MIRCPACRAECARDESECWQCEYRFRGNVTDNITGAPQLLPSRSPRRVWKPRLSQQATLILGLVAMLVAAGFTALSAANQVRVPEFPPVLALPPLTLALTALIGIALVSRREPAYRNAGVGVSNSVQRFSDR